MLCTWSRCSLGWESMEVGRPTMRGRTDKHRKVMRKLVRGRRTGAGKTVRHCLLGREKATKKKAHTGFTIHCPSWREGRVGRNGSKERTYRRKIGKWQRGTTSHLLSEGSWRRAICRTESGSLTSTKAGARQKEVSRTTLLPVALC